MAGLIKINNNILVYRDVTIGNNYQFIIEAG
jgi:hypothetical protein